MQNQIVKGTSLNLDSSQRGFKFMSSIAIKEGVNDHRRPPRIPAAAAGQFPAIFLHGCKDDNLTGYL